MSIEAMLKKKLTIRYRESTAMVDHRSNFSPIGYRNGTFDSKIKLNHVPMIF
jgi:hypothetical protein